MDLFSHIHFNYISQHNPLRNRASISIHVFFMQSLAIKRIISFYFNFPNWQFKSYTMQLLWCQNLNSYLSDATTKFILGAFLGCPCFPYHTFVKSPYLFLSLTFILENKNRLSTLRYKDILSHGSDCFWSHDFCKENDWPVFAVRFMANSISLSLLYAARKPSHAFSVVIDIGPSFYFNLTGIHEINVSAVGDIQLCMCNRATHIAYTNTVTSSTMEHVHNWFA